MILNIVIACILAVFLFYGDPSVFDLLHQLTVSKLGDLL